MLGYKTYSDNQLADIIYQSERRREKAFNELYFRYENKLYNHIRHLCNNIDTTNDIFQQTWMKFFNTLMEGAELTHTFSYLLRISHNLYINHIRDTKETVQWGIDSNTSFENDSNIIHEFEEKLEMDELVEIIRASLDIIDIDSKEVIIYKKFDGLTYKEIAYIYNISAEGAKKRYERAIAKLHKVLTPYIHEMFN